VAPLESAGLPSASQRSLPDARTSPCELCELQQATPMAYVLVIDGPDGLPVPFLVCDACQRALEALQALLTAASRSGDSSEPSEP